MKNIIIVILTFLILSNSVAYASYENETELTLAQSANANILVDGSIFQLTSYNINGYNYLKLRDVAFILNGTDVQFEVEWNESKNAINLVTNNKYTALGSELSPNVGEDKYATSTNSIVYKNGKKISLEAYNIDGNNYFKLRDLAEIFDFSTVWDGNLNNILISTNKNYSMESKLNEIELSTFISNYYLNSSSSSEVPKSDLPMTEEEKFEAEVIELVNIERAKVGSPPLTTTPEHTEAAQIRADECVELFSHTRPDGTKFSTVFDEVGIASQYRGENLGSGYKTPERLVDGLMNSDGHRENILNPEYKYIGVGYNSDNFWSQLFSK